MAALKCLTCKRWSLESGCTLHSYTMMKRCMTDQQDFSIPAEDDPEPEGGAEDAERH